MESYNLQALLFPQRHLAFHENFQINCAGILFPSAYIMQHTTHLEDS